MTIKDKEVKAPEVDLFGEVDKDLNMLTINEQFKRTHNS